MYFSAAQNVGNSENFAASFLLNSSITCVYTFIESGVFGKSGERFLSTRELCDKYGISNKTAIGILKTLELNGAIVTVGYKHFILNGKAEPTAPLFAETKREINIHPQSGWFYIFGHSPCLQATHKCVFSWPASHALFTCYP